MTFALSYNATVGNPVLDVEARGITRVRAKITRKRAITDDEAVADARPYVVELVRGEEYAGAPRMQAYRRVGAAIGRSESWVRKLVGGVEPVVLRRSTWESIAIAYEALCERIEAKAEHERLKAALLMEKAHATREGLDQPDRQDVPARHRGDLSHRDEETS